MALSFGRRKNQSSLFRGRRDPGMTADLLQNLEEAR